MMTLGSAPTGSWIRSSLIVLPSGNPGHFPATGGWPREKTTGKLKGNCFLRIWKLRSTLHVRIGLICCWMIYITLSFFLLSTFIEIYMYCHFSDLSLYLFLVTLRYDNITCQCIFFQWSWNQ